MDAQNNEANRNLSAIAQHLNTMIQILDKIQKTLASMEEKISK